MTFLALKTMRNYISQDLQGSGGEVFGFVVVVVVCFLVFVF